MKMYEYYEKQTILPTFADFRDNESMQRYVDARVEFISGKMCIPRRFFAGAEVLEFGPDSGENALAFASWGAKMTLVEPNPSAHKFIRDYFERFGLQSQLTALVQADVESFNSGQKFDLVVAEGFIYTVPTDRWVAAFEKLVRPQGLFLVTYLERLGSFIEFCLKALHSGVRSRTDLDPVAAAHKLYDVKWDSIPHTRKFESWVMDVMMNPFVRLRYAVDAPELLRLAHDAGFAQYSAWPAYRDPLQVYWHKRLAPKEEEMAQSVMHLRRSSLSFLTGKKLYIAGDDVAALGALVKDADQLVSAVDAAIDDPQDLTGLLSAFERILDSVEKCTFVSDPGELESAIQLLRTLFRAFSLLHANDLEGLYSLTSSDRAFLEAWGVPTEIVVFRKLGELA